MEDLRKKRKDKLAKLAAYEEYKNDAAERHERSRDKREQQLVVPQKSTPQKESPPKEGEEEEEMQRMLGFTNFASTKNKNHMKSAREAIVKNSQVRREYRQYMNRRGGFNRNLDKL